MNEIKDYRRNTGLKLVTDAKEKERKGNFKEAAKGYKAAKKIFKEINETNLYTRALVGHYANIIKYYLDGRDIEGLSDNIDEECIDKIDKGIREAGLKKIDEYDMLISAYRELEKIFSESNMDDKANDMYYKWTKLLHGFFWRRALLKDRKYGSRISKWVSEINKWKSKFGKAFGRSILIIFKWGSKIIDVFKSLINLFFYIFCGHGERPIRAIGFSILIISFFSGIYCCFDLIEYSPQANGQGICSTQAFYFSIVAFSTLGFGDILPRNWIGQLLVAFEVMMGYFMLGVMIAVINRKITR